MAGTIAVYYRTDAAFRRQTLTHNAPEGGLDRGDYKHVTNVDNAPGLEGAFRLMNVVDGDELPVRLHVRSMMWGDVLVDEDGDVWFCAFDGWERTRWVDR